MSPKKYDDKSEWAKNLGLFSVIVSELIGFTGIGVALGYWAWTHWSAPWWVVLLSSLIGLGLASYRIALLSRKMSANDPN